MLACVSAVGAAGRAGAAPGTSPTVTHPLAAASARVAQLQRTRTVDFEGTKVVRYRQEVDGVPVLGGDVAVMGDAGAGGAALVTDGSVAKIEAPTTAKVSAARAIAIARAATGAAGLRAKPTASLAIDPQRQDALVRKVMLASSRPMRDFQVLIDATSGKILQSINVLHYDHARGAKASLYTPNPVVMNGGYGGIGRTRKADHDNKDTPKLTKLRARVRLPLIDKGQDCLKGAYVEARLGRSAKPVCRKSLNWTNVTRSDPRFEALEAYQEITQIQGYYHSLGFVGSANLHPQRQTVIADAFAEDNSFFSPGDGKVRYGKGGVDDAEDGDVITHEYGHSIEAYQDPGFSNCNCFQAGALGEGWGDFEAAINTSISPHVPDSYRRHAEFCAFDWDGTGGYGGPGVAPCGRISNGSDGTETYSQAVRHCAVEGSPEIHCLGEVWTHGLIDLLNSLPRDSQGRPPVVVDLLTSQFAYQDNETFKGAVNLLLDADDAIYGNGVGGSGTGVHHAAICAEMKTARGINASGCG